MASRQLVFGSSTISVDGVSVGSTYDITLGNPTISFNEMVDFFTISGTASLSSSLTITSTSAITVPTKLRFLSRASMTIGANTITIFGHNVTATEALSPFLVEAWNAADGNGWQAVLSRVEIPASGLVNSQLAQMAGKTIKMNSGASPDEPEDVSFSNAMKAMNLEYDVVHLIFSFNSGRVPGRYNATLPYDGEVERVDWTVITAIGPGDNAIINLGVNASLGGGFSDFANFPIEIPAGSAMNTVGTVLTPTSNTFSNSPNNYLCAETSKTTWGGEVLISVVIRKDV